MPSARGRSIPARAGAPPSSASPRRSWRRPTSGSTGRSSGGREPQQRLEHLPPPLREVAEQRRSLFEVDDVREQLRPDVLPPGEQQLERLTGEALAAPDVAEPARDAADLRAADRQPVVVELLA